MCAYRDVTDERTMTAPAGRDGEDGRGGPARRRRGARDQQPARRHPRLRAADEARRGAQRSVTSSRSQLIEESALRCKRIVESLLQVQPPHRRRTTAALRAQPVRGGRGGALPGPAEEVTRGASWSCDSPPTSRRSSGTPGSWGRCCSICCRTGCTRSTGEAGTLHREHRAARHRRLLQRRATPAPASRPGAPRASSSRPSPPSRRAQGTGLGLAIAYRIVQDHGGRFEVQSAARRGLAPSPSFIPHSPDVVSSVRTPMSKRPAARFWWWTTTRSSSARSPRYSSERATTVVAIDDAVEGLAASKDPSIDVAVLDIKMPQPLRHGPAPGHQAGAAGRGGGR